MASPDTVVDPLADSDQTKMTNDSLKFPPNLSESDLLLIKQMQMMSAIPGLQPKHRTAITPKSIPEILCTCPQKCDEKIPLKVRTYMFKYFHAMSQDRSKQEMLLLRFIEMKSLAQRLKEDNKRVQCRYKAPTSMKAIEFIFEDESVNLSEDDESIENDAQPKAKKAKTNKPNLKDEGEVYFDQNISLRTDPTIRYRIDKYGYTEVCQKAYMNVFLVPEKRVRAVREKLVASKRVHLEQEMAQTAVMNAELETAVKIAQDLAAGCKPLLQMLQQNQKLADEDDPCDISSQLLDAIDSDIELVNNFFYNQLWKPEIFDPESIEKYDSFTPPVAKKSKLNGEKFDGTPNTPKPAISNTMSSALLDETFDSVISASASMAEEADQTFNETSGTFNETSETFNETQGTMDETQDTVNDTEVESPLNETPMDASEMGVDDAAETGQSEDPFGNKDPLEDKQTPEDLEVANASPPSICNGMDEPLNLNIAAKIVPISLPLPQSPDSSLSSQDKGADVFATAMDLSVPSPHRNGQSTSQPSRPSSQSISGSRSGSSSSSRYNGQTSGSRLNGIASRSNGSFKAKSSHRNGQHRSEPMRKSSPSIQNILNNHHAALFPPNMFPPAFNADLSKYLGGLESSISITPKSSRRRGNDAMSRANDMSAALTAQLIQQALSQSSQRVMDTQDVASLASKYSGSSSLNQILNIPDSVSITPTLVDNSK